MYLERILKTLFGMGLSSLKNSICPGTKLQRVIGQQNDRTKAKRMYASSLFPFPFANVLPRRHRPSVPRRGATSFYSYSTEAYTNILEALYIQQRLDYKLQ